VAVNRWSLPALAASAGIALGSAGAASAASPPEKVRGTIVSATGNSLVIKMAAGSTTVQLGSKTAFAGAVPGSTTDIVPGKFLGIASAPGAGPNRALEVVVFADSMRGVGEGDYGWDLAVPGGTEQKTITMKYKGGSRTLVVPAERPWSGWHPARRAC